MRDFSAPSAGGMSLAAIAAPAQAGAVVYHGNAQYWSQSNLVALTGKRNVGKSTAADKLVNEYGFVRIHAFDGGKAATVQYFEYLLAGLVKYPAAYALRMVYGDLKDLPCEHLPGGVAPRFFMEEFGKFMGVTLGTPWTMEMEIARARRLHGHDAKLIVESLIYEADVFRNLGGYILRLERPGHEGPKVGSDAAQAGIKEDATISATSLEALASGVDEWAEKMEYQRK